MPETEEGEDVPSRFGGERRGEECLVLPAPIIPFLLPAEIEEDAADIGERKRLQRLAEVEVERKRAAQAVQRGLPIPRSVNHDVMRAAGAATDELQVRG